MSSYFKEVFSSNSSSSYTPPTIGAAPTVAAANIIVVKKKKTTRFGFGSSSSSSVVRQTEFAAAASSVTESRYGDEVEESATVVSVAIETPQNPTTSEEEEKVVVEDPEPASPVVEEPIDESGEQPQEENVEPVETDDSQETVDKVHQLLTSLSTIIESSQLLADRQTELENKRKETEINISNLLMKQNEFCEAEDFDQADALNEQIDENRSLLVDLAKELFVDIPKLFSESRKEEKKICEEIICLDNDKLEEIEKMRNELVAEYEAKKVSLETRVEQFVVIDNQFSQREEDIHCRKKVLVERKSEVEDLIEEESRLLEKEKEIAQTEYDRLDALILDLQAQLAAAMEARSECAMTISGSDLKLNNIRAKFCDIIEELEDEETMITEEVGELLEEKISAGGGDANRVRDELENACKIHEEKIKQIESEEKELSARREVFGLFVSALTELHDATSAASRDAADLRTSYVDACEYCRFLAESVKEIETEISLFKQSLISARETELPALEAAKKAAVMNRAFREAKEIAEEIKKISDDLTMANEKQTLLKNKLSDARRDLAEARAIEEDLSRKLSESEIIVSEIFENSKIKFSISTSSLKESVWCKRFLLSKGQSLEEQVVETVSE